MKAKLKLIIIMVIAAITLLGLIWFGLYQFTTREAKANGQSADDILASSIETEPITTNLEMGDYIKLRFRIQTNSEEASEELSERDFQVRNIILRLAASMTDAEAKSPQGIEKLEEELMNEINEFLQSGTVVQVYTTDKIIQ
ncbi:flagellar basal body-associated FliL family protein [Bacillus sp. T3]|uniref:flagellar basal body-associated FliL family protein n=1 Tax=Bacillus sp. T3 TaxID=467262 RepID=UPI002980AE47|nr:flagellar basal body-associated FliL family protein [Bacillus sp. T3]